MGIFLYVLWIFLLAQNPAFYVSPVLSVMHFGALNLKESIISAVSKEQGSRCNVTLSIFVVKLVLAKFVTSEMVWIVIVTNQIQKGTCCTWPNQAKKCMCINAWVHKNKFDNNEYPLQNH